MGATLSVMNDTDCEWSCKIGPDQAALNVFATTATAVGIAATVVVSVGQTAPLAGALVANGVTHVLGVSATSAAAVATAAASAAAATRAVSIAVVISERVAKLVTKELEKSGYTTLKPGDRLKVILPASLWQQCHCTRTWVDTEERQIVTEYIYMRPIFSAALVGQTKTHAIDWWKHKKGHHTVDRNIIQ